MAQHIAATGPGKGLTPNQYMTRLDDAGEAYWLEDVTLINGHKIARADVLDHGETWLKLQEAVTDYLRDSDRVVWTVRADHIVCFRLMEG